MDGRLLLAFSGGPDSIGLAVHLRAQNPLLAYVDHRLRGPREGRRERALVKAAAHSLGLELVRSRVTTGNSEGAARAARYRALNAMVVRHGCTAIATAHTADDRAETILFNLMRGTGLRGLAALRSPVEIDGVLRVRPALALRRDALQRLGRGVVAVIDRSNRSTAHARARIRHFVLPAWATHLGQDPVPLLCALGDAAADVRRVLEERAGRMAASAGRDALLAEPEATFPYLVEALRASDPPLTRRAYASLRAFLSAGRGDRAHTTPGGEAWWRGGRDKILLSRP